MKEIEYKWRASRRDFEKVVRRAKDKSEKLIFEGKERIRDSYIDTPERFFEKVGIGCRIRQKRHDGTELTMKATKAGKNGLFAREERSLHLPPFRSKKKAIAHLKKGMLSKVEILFTVKEKRENYRIHLPHHTRAVLSLDLVEIKGELGKKRFAMVELELEGGSYSKFKAFGKELAHHLLKPAKKSKYDRGMRLTKKGGRKVSSKILRKTLRHELKKRIDAFIQEVSSIDKELKSAPIHDTRIAARRLQAALKIWEKITSVNVKEPLEKVKQWVALFGKQRDLDLCSKEISHLRHKRKRMHKKILSKLNSSLYHDFVKELKKTAEAPIKKGTLRKAWKALQATLEKVLENGSTLSKKSSDHALHKLRISFKKLRYLAEFFQPLFSHYDLSLDKLIDQTQILQEILGDHQDSVNALALIEKHRHHLSSHKAHHLKKKYTHRLKSTRHAFLKEWPRYKKNNLWYT